VQNVLRVVTFDMDYTLRQVHPFPPHLRFQELCADAGCPISEEQALAGARARKRYDEARKVRGERATPAWSHGYARVGLEAAGVPGDLDALAFAVRDARRRRTPPSVLDPDVPQVLEALCARGWRLAVVSNWGADLAAALAEYGIARYFECVVDSATAGAAKPDPRIYEVACAGLHVEPGECVHVGDSVVDDVGVARAVRAHPVLYDPLEVLDGACPRIARLAELPAVLQGLRSGS
jgi:putative hydrolase of the HAD superfamily